MVRLFRKARSLLTPFARKVVCSTPEEFGNIVIRANGDGSLVRVKDVARIELGAQTYNLESRLNGQPAAALGLYQLPGSNAVEASNAVRAYMEKAKLRFPADMDYAVSLDQTHSVREGMAKSFRLWSKRSCWSL